MLTNMLATVFVIIVALAAHSYAEDKKQQQPTPPRYRHVMDNEGKILASVDTKDNSVDFKTECKEVVPVLLQNIDATVAQCNQAIQSLQPKKAEPKGKK